jgi:hypothetical protein
MLKYKKPEANHTINISYARYQRLNDILDYQNKILLSELAKKYKLNYNELVAKYITEKEK